MRWQKLEHRFVRHLPDTLEPGVLYISVEYATASHSCCCGCGEEVVTPFSPVGWRMIFDGETVSLWPSIGNWNLPCRSHYVIKQGRVIEASPWTDEQIAAEGRRYKAAKARYYEPPELTEAVEAVESTPVSTAASKDALDLWSRIKYWLANLQ